MLLVGSCTKDEDDTIKFRTEIESGKLLDFQFRIAIPAEGNLEIVTHPKHFEISEIVSGRIYSQSLPGFTGIDKVVIESQQGRVDENSTSLVS